ncbi:hypothetical protein AYK26_04505 [Euryarchaeota archaeon SM23-78]|nr:MAG: hypothetical protein AYK26_04505 [Euryarchaeota archaeon SM23-78]
MTEKSLELLKNLELKRFVKESKLGIKKIDMKSLSLEDALGLNQGDKIYINPESVAFAPMNISVKKKHGKTPMPEENLRFDAYHALHSYLTGDTPLGKKAFEYYALSLISFVEHPLLVIMEISTKPEEEILVNWDFLKVTVTSVELYKKPVVYAGIHLKEIKGPEPGFYHVMFSILSKQ